jgi:hypothetical protein
MDFFAFLEFPLWISQGHSMKPVEIPVFRGAGDIIFRAIKIPTKSSVLPLSLNDPVGFMKNLDASVKIWLFLLIICLC